MEQYEEVWKSQNNNYYLRTRDVDTLKTTIKKITPEFEIFEESPTGEYKFILNENIRLNRRTFKTNKERSDYISTAETIGKKLYGNQPAQYSFIRDNFFLNGLDVKQRIWYLDIEAIADSGFPDSSKAEYPINVIQIYDSYTDKNIILTFKPVNIDKVNVPKNTIIKSYNSEKDLLEGFLSLLEKLEPSIIATWNGEDFDIPYITNRIKNFDGINYRRLSPIKVVKEDSYMGKTKFIWEGITNLDLMLAYKEFTYITQTSYSLDNIALVELGEGNGKVDYGEFKTIKDFYKGNWEKFVEYSARDTEILKKLDDKLKLCDLTKVLAYRMGINISDTFGTVKPWGMYLTDLAYKENLIMPWDEKHELDKGIVGGYVAPPQRGLHSWIAAIDVNSMYPLLGMQAHNMSAETYIEPQNLQPDARELYDKLMRDEDESVYLSEDGLNQELVDNIEKVCKKYNYSFGMNAFFDNSKVGIIPKVIDNIYKERKQAKNRMLRYKTLASRISDILKSETFGTNNSPITFERFESNDISFDEINNTDYSIYSNDVLKNALKIAEDKEAYWNTNQMALKISMNSLYGALSNAYFVLFNRDIAASITGNGRIYIRGVSNFINSKLNIYLKNDIKKNYIIYNDTDSSYIKIEDVVDRIIQKMFPNYEGSEEDLEKLLSIILKFVDGYIDKWVDEFTDMYANKFNSKQPEVIGAKLEKIAIRSLFTDKKRYAMRVIYDEGDIRIKNPKISVTGLDIVQSSTPKWCRKELKKVLDIFFDGTEKDIQDFIVLKQTEFNQQNIEDISRVSGVTSLEYDYDGKYYRINENGKRIACPINSRASLVHNKFIDLKNLNERFQKITEKDKIKYIFLKLPNSVNENVFAYLDEDIINETEINKFIDYEEMFDKFFVSPMRIMMDACSYSEKKSNSLDDWF